VLSAVGCVERAAFDAALGILEGLIELRGIRVVYASCSRRDVRDFDVGRSVDGSGDEAGR
jgi:hypothetical protein